MLPKNILITKEESEGVSGESQNTDSAPAPAPGEAADTGTENEAQE